MNHRELHAKMIELDWKYQRMRARYLQEREDALGLARLYEVALEELDAQAVVLHESMRDLDDEQGSPAFGAVERSVRNRW